MSDLRILSVLWIGVLTVPGAAQPPALRTDAFGDPLPPAALARLGTVRFRHAAAVDDVHFVAGGKWLLSGGSDNTVRFWEPQTGREVYTFPGHAGRLAPDGKTLVAWGYGCQVWDFASGKELPWAAAQLRDVYHNASAAFMPGGKSLVVIARASDTNPGEDGKLKVQTFDLATGKRLSAWLGPSWDGRISARIFPAGDIVGVNFGSGWSPENHIELRDAVTGKLLASCPFFSMVFPSADGSRFATEEVQPEGAKERIHLLVLDSKTGKELYRYRTGVETNAALSPDGAKVAFMARYQSHAAKPLVRVADVATGKLLHELPCAPGSYGSLRFSETGTWLVAAQDSGVLQVWDVARGQLVREVERSLGNSPWSAEVSPDGKLLAAADHNIPQVQVWSLATGKMLPDLYVTEFGPYSVAFSRDGKKLATLTPYGGACVWEAANGSLIERLPPVPSKGVYLPLDEARLHWADDGHLHLIGLGSTRRPPDEDGDPLESIYLVDLTTAKPLRSFGESKFRIRGWTLSADQRTLAVAIGHKIALWDVQTGKARGQLPLADEGAMPKRPDDDPGHPVGLAFCPNGKTLAVCDRLYAGGAVVGFGGLTIRELASGKIRNDPWREDQRNRLIQHLARSDGYVQLLFPPDGKSLAVATRGTVLLWDLGEGREIRRFGGLDLVLASLVFSPDGKLLAGINYGAGLCLWEVSSGSIVRQVTNGKSGVTAFAFSADGKTLATALSDTTVLVWDVKELLTANAPEPLSAKALELLWKDLASDDAAVAGKAIVRLQKGGAAAAAFLKGQVKPVPPPDPKLLAQLLGELESTRFAAREKAGQELERLGDQALPALQEILRGKPSLETRIRVTKLVARMEGPIHDVKVLQLIRAIEVLEGVGGTDGQAVLEAMAKGMPGHRVTEAAQDALRRVKGP
jgi:WD40 repeat protein